MAAAGCSPGSADRYVNAKNSPPDQKGDIPDNIKRMVLPITVNPL